MAWYKRREISMGLTSLVILIFLIDFNLDIPTLKAVTNNLTTWGTVIGAFAIGLGYINMYQHYGRKVQRKTPGWPYALWLVIATTVVTLVGAWQGRTGDLMTFFYDSFVGPLDATFYSIAIFYMASAAYRAFKFRSVESTILLTCAFIMLLKNAPIGEVIWPGFGTIGTWLMNYPVMGVSRGITLSTTLGSVALGLRVLLGKEYSYLAGTGERKE